MWRSGSGPAEPVTVDSSGPTLDGAYALVYDPLTLGLVDYIALGGVGDDTMNLVFIAGYVYAAIEGNQFSAWPVVNKINAASRAVVEFGSTSYAGAVSKLGHVSRDSARTYISVSNGIGSGTLQMAQTEPFAISLGVTNTDWVFCSVWNPFTNVRAYAGYGDWIDLHGPSGLITTVDTSGYYTGTPQSHRLVYRTCTPYIFAACCGQPHVLMVDTITGAVTAFCGDIDVYALYYSPETDRVYVECRPGFLAPHIVRVYQASNLSLIDALSGFGAALGYGRGNSVYIGGETFIACESSSAPLSRMWRVSFPH